MMTWFKNWLINFLGLDQLATRCQVLETENSNLKEAVAKIERCFNVGVDVQPIEGRHWAIICVRQRGGGRSIIRFVDLSGRHPHEIDEFMKFFTPNRANKHWDVPHRYMIK